MKRSIRGGEKKGEGKSVALIASWLLLSCILTFQLQRFDTIFISLCLCRAALMYGTKMVRSRDLFNKMQNVQLQFLHSTYSHFYIYCQPII